MSTAELFFDFSRLFSHGLFVLSRHSRGFALFSSKFERAIAVSDLKPGTTHQVKCIDLRLFVRWRIRVCVCASFAIADALAMAIEKGYGGRGCYCRINARLMLCLVGLYWRLIRCNARLMILFLRDYCWCSIFCNMTIWDFFEGLRCKVRSGATLNMSNDYLSAIYGYFLLENRALSLCGCELFMNLLWFCYDFFDFIVIASSWNGFTRLCRLRFSYGRLRYLRVC